MATKPSERPRGVPTLNGKTPLQICQEMQYDPLLEMIKMAKGRITVRDKDGTPLKDENGKWETKPLLTCREKIEVDRVLMEVCYPKLRTQEVKEQRDFNITLTINRFEDRPTPKQIDAPPVIEIEGAA